MKKLSQRFVACGMYAFTDAQRVAWRELFDRFAERMQLAEDDLDLVFEHGSPVLERPGMWFGHTCGYPLISFQHETMSPFCVPLFDVPGTDGKLYSSRIIVHADARLDSFVDCRGRVAAMNNRDSNSGMNVLRHAVAEIHSRRPFFSRVLTTGGHLNSVEAVAHRDADVAAIDCVSFQLIADRWPDLAAQVRVIGDSVQTTGLPLVMAHAVLGKNDTGEIIDKLNQALQDCATAVRSVLHLSGFEAVTMADYQNVIDVEQFAIDQGYPELV